MKAKYLLVVLITLVFVGCDDNTGSLGLNILPESDGVKVEIQNFTVQTSSTVSGPVFAKTSTGYVGRFTDKEYGFGYYEGSFLTELNCVDDLTFPQPYDEVTNRDTDNMIGDIEESFLYARLDILFSSFFGDSLNVVQVGAYELDKKLEKNHNTDIDPEIYLKKDGLLGKKTYTAADLADSTRVTSSSESFLGNIIIQLPDDFGRKIIKHNWDKPEDFKDSQTFTENVFNGVYIKNETGDGTILYVDQVLMTIIYKSFALDSVGDIMQTSDSLNLTDSIEYRYRTFASTKEVIQANQIVISEEVEDKAKEKDWTYLKSPAGIFTKAKLPIGDILRGLDMERDTINAVKLSLDAYHHDTEYLFSMGAPSTILLIREKEAADFFKDNMLPNNTSSYVAYYQNNQYVFNNLTRLINAYSKEMEDAKAEMEKEGGTWDEEAWLDDNQVLLIPVTLSINSASTITNIQHDLKPAFVKLKGGDPNFDGSLIDLQVVYSRFNQ